MIRVCLTTFLLTCFAFGKQAFSDLQKNNNTQYSSDLVLNSQKGDKNQKKIISEYAVLRVQETIFFLSDLKEYFEALSVLECLDFDFLALNGIGWKKHEGQDINAQRALQVNDNFFQTHRPQFLKVIRLIKLEKFVNRQDAVISSKFYKKINFQKCISKKIESMPYRLQSLLKIEGFLQDRFNGKNIHSFVSSLDKKIFHDVFF